MFESLREVVTAPITAISETIQTAVSNLQSDKQEVSSTSGIGLEPFLESASSSNIVTASDEIDRREPQDSFTTEPVSFFLRKSNQWRCIFPFTGFTGS